MNMREYFTIAICFLDTVEVLQYSLFTVLKVALIL